MTDHNEYWMNPEDSQLGKWQRELQSVSGSPTFCILPWIHFATRPNGDMRLCCSANASGAGSDHEVGIIKKEDGTPANFGKDTPILKKKKLALLVNVYGKQEHGTRTVQIFRSQ